MGAQAVDTAIVTLAQLKARLSITNTSDDTRLSNLIVGYSGVVSSYCGRKFEQATYTEYLDGTGSESLWLPNWPVTTPMDAANGIWVDPLRKFGASTKLTEDAPSSSTQGDYFIVPGEASQGEVIRLGSGLVPGGAGGWPRGRQTIKVTYQAGYAQASIPGPVVEAVLRMAARAYEIASSGAEATSSQSSQAGGGSVSYVGHSLPTDVREMLEDYRAERIPG